MKLGIITATTNEARSAGCIESWRLNALQDPLIIHTLVNGTASQPYLGTVPAFRWAMDHMLEETDVDIIACLHDDFEIHESKWDQKVIKHFERHQECGLAGFGGAIGLGLDEIYTVPYNPMQLARIGFRSNLDDAEAHGSRSLLAERVACLDGFSQVGRRQFWEGYRNHSRQYIRYTSLDKPWTMLQHLGFVHHFYDGALGCIAKRFGWETWYLPLRGKHYGGQTAVGDQGYGDWAKRQIPEGDQGFWKAAHRIGYDAFKDVLPIRL